LGKRQTSAELLLAGVTNIGLLSQPAQAGIEESVAFELHMHHLLDSTSHGDDWNGGGSNPYPRMRSVLFVLGCRPDDSGLQVRAPRTVPENEDDDDDDDDDDDSEDEDEEEDY
jgi:hypothetical protein